MMLNAWISRVKGDKNREYRGNYKKYLPVGLGAHYRDNYKVKDKKMKNMKSAEHPLHVAPKREVKINSGNAGQDHDKEKSAKSKPDIMLFWPIRGVFDYERHPENKQYFHQNIKRDLLGGNKGE